MVLRIIRNALASLTVATGFTPMMSLVLLGIVGVGLWMVMGGWSRPSQNSGGESESSG